MQPVSNIFGYLCCIFIKLFIEPIQIKRLRVDLMLLNMLPGNLGSLIASVKLEKK